MGYILFSSKDEIFIYAAYTWDGIIEYSYDNNKWNEWSGEKIANNKIYMRGINNTVVSNYSNWTISGTNVKCQGNIENLLDYKSVINNVHPIMKPYCFSFMFYKCYNLIEAPQLPSIQLSDFCYSHMFDGCKKLTIPPELPSTNLAIDCYAYMFYNCSSLIQSPNLATIPLLYKCCYWKMFGICTSLLISPMFPNLTIAKEAIVNQDIFDKCPIQFININNKLYDTNVLKLL